MTVVSEEILDLVKCTKRFALNVVKNVKFHSNHKKENQFTAENATQRKNDSNSLRHNP